MRKHYVKIGPLPTESKTKLSSDESINWIYMTLLKCVRKDFVDHNINFIHVSYSGCWTKSFETVCCFEIETPEHFKYNFKNYAPNNPRPGGIIQFQVFHSNCQPPKRVLIYKAAQPRMEWPDDMVPDGFEIVVADKENCNPFQDKVFATLVHVYKLYGRNWSRYMIPNGIITNKISPGVFKTPDIETWAKVKARFHPYRIPKKVQNGDEKN